jgi:hypothetical protein
MDWNTDHLPILFDIVMDGSERYNPRPHLERFEKSQDELAGHVIFQYGDYNKFISTNQIWIPVI